MLKAIFAALMLSAVLTAQITTVTAEGAAFDSHQHYGLSYEKDGLTLDVFGLRTEPGQQGVLGFRLPVALPGNWTLSPGLYVVAGSSPQLRGAGIGLGINGQIGRCETEALVIQYTSISQNAYTPYEIGEGSVMCRVTTWLWLGPEAEIMHNGPEQRRTPVVGGGVKLPLKKLFGKDGAVSKPYLKVSALNHGGIHIALEFQIKRKKDP